MKSLKDFIGFLNSAFNNRVGLRGEVIAELHGPDGELKQRSVTHNLVTVQGDKFAAKAIYTAAYSGWGMKLGTATDVAAKSGAGSFIAAAADYVSGSAHALDSSSPKAGTSDDIVQFCHTWAAGEATADGIWHVSICDNTTNAGEADATHTYAISKFTAAINKAAGDSLAVTWNVTYLGA